MTSSYMHFRPLDGPKLGIRRLLPLCSGYSIPQLGLGTYRLAPAAAEEVIPIAVGSGFRHIDCAKAYNNEHSVGIGLKKAMKTRRIPRDSFFITSKLWPTDQHPDHVRRACLHSIEALGVGYLDLYLVHWPVCWKHPAKESTLLSIPFSTEEEKYPRDPVTGAAAVDTNVSLRDTWAAMSQLVKEGLVRSIGLCNSSARDIEAVCSNRVQSSPGSSSPLIGSSSNATTSDTATPSEKSRDNVAGEKRDSSDEDFFAPPVLNQIEFHPACHDSELVRVHIDHDMLTAAYCPLGMPTRTTPKDFKPLVNDEMLLSLSQLTGYSVPRLLLNWNLDMNNVVICKASTKAHLESNAKAAQFTLSDSVRLLLNSFPEKVRAFRVMNPENFTAEPGKRYFPEPSPPQPTAPFGPYVEKAKK